MSQRAPPAGPAPLTEWDPLTEADPLLLLDPPSDPREDEGQHSAPPPLPPVTVTSFSGTIRLYSSTVGGARPGKPLLLLLPWLGAQARGLARYLALYLRRGMDVLVVGTTACHVLCPWQGQRLAGRLLRLLDHGGDGSGDGDDGGGGGKGGGGCIGGDGGGNGGGGDGGGNGGGASGNGGGGDGGGNGGGASGNGGGGDGGVNGGGGGSGVSAGNDGGDTGGGDGGGDDDAGASGGDGGDTGGGSGLATRPLLVHAISAGAYTFAQVLLLLHHRPQQCRRLAPRFRGIVYDSLVTGGFGDMARGIAGTVGTPPLRALVHAGARLYLGVLGCWGGREFERARGAFASPPLRCPLLLFYSLDDGLCQPAVLRALLRGWRAQGIRAHAWGWPHSRHAAHLRQHPDEYRRALLAFLRSLEESPKARL